MCLSKTNLTMCAWLETQVRVLEVWREELAMHADIDLGTVMRVERHYQWLTSELVFLETDSNAGLAS